MAIEYDYNGVGVLRDQRHIPNKDWSKYPPPPSPNPALPNINKILQKKQPILNSTARLQKIYKETPVVAYRRSPNLRDLLVRAKLKNPANSATNQPHGTFRCNSKHGCLTCPHIEDGRTTYTFSNTGEVREIKQHINCKSTNLTYMIECQKCKKQYIGETKRTLRERFTDHRQATNNPSHANATAAVPTHFNLPDHSIKDMKLIPLELQPTNNASRRKAREACFIEKGQTLTPHGINRRNEHQLVNLFYFIFIFIFIFYIFACYSHFSDILFWLFWYFLHFLALYIVMYFISLYPTCS